MPTKVPFRVHMLLAAILLLAGRAWASPVSVLDAGLKADGVTDDTDALQAALAAGKTDLHFPRGKYLLGTISIPADSKLQFAPGAVVRINPAALKKQPLKAGPGEGRPRVASVLFLIAGDRVTIENLDLDFSLPDGGQVDSRHLSPVIYAQGASDLRFSGLRAIRRADRELKPIEQRSGGGGRYLPGKRGDPGRPSLIIVERCRNVVLENSQAEHMSIMIEAVSCAEVTVRGNRAVSCVNISAFHGGSEWMRHLDNWSRDVRHQCVWRGSNSNDVRSLKPDDARRGTANLVVRGPYPDDPEFKPGSLGGFDVQITNNYGEYGRTLAWGNKGRQVIFQGNIARFMQDYCLGTEGSENVIFANNITINSAVAGIACYYWSEKLVITGNLVLSRDEPWDEQWTWLPRERYRGGLLRLHAIGHPERKSGAGKAVISGNLFMSELPDRSRGVRVEAGRDVLFSGNKIVNGYIFARGSPTGQLTITGNEFIHNLPAQLAAIRIQSTLREATITNNVLRRSDEPLGPMSVGADDALSWRGPSVGPAAVQSPRTLPAADLAERLPEPAIAVEGLADRGAGLRLIAGNQVEGWKQAILARSLSREQMDRYVIRGNHVDGSIAIETAHGKLRHFEDGNLDLAKLERMRVEVITTSGHPLKLPEPAPEPTAEETEE